MTKTEKTYFEMTQELFNDTIEMRIGQYYERQIENAIIKQYGIDTFDNVYKPSVMRSAENLLLGTDRDIVNYSVSVLRVHYVNLVENEYVPGTYNTQVDATIIQEIPLLYKYDEDDNTAFDIGTVSKNSKNRMDRLDVRDICDLYHRNRNGNY